MVKEVIKVVVLNIIGMWTLCYTNQVDSGVNASSKLGGRSAKMCGVWDGVFPSPPGRGLGRAIFFFCDLEMAYFGEFW